MAAKTGIVWVATFNPDGSSTEGSTWNPFRGTSGLWTCTKTSPACDFCYAERLNMQRGGPGYLPGLDTPRLDERVMQQPVSWRDPRKIFVCSMTDLFEQRHTVEQIIRVLDVMVKVPRHTFLVLTKRADRMADVVHAYLAEHRTWRLPDHIWLGATVENATWLERRRGALSRLRDVTPVRFVSIEPMLQPYITGDMLHYAIAMAGVNWVIAGGESGGPDGRMLVARNGYGRWEATPDALRIAREYRDVCTVTKTPYLFKQWGGATNHSGGRRLDGREWNEQPDTYAGHPAERLTERHATPTTPQPSQDGAEWGNRAQPALF